MKKIFKQMISIKTLIILIVFMVCVLLMLSLYSIYQETKNVDVTMSCAILAMPLLWKIIEIIKNIKNI